MAHSTGTGNGGGDPRELLSEAVRGEIDGWLAKFPPDGKRSAVIQSLMAVQRGNGGWISRELMDAVADYIGLPRVWVYEVATFYSMLDVHEAGPHKVSVCNNISCMLCGGEDLAQHVERKLGIKRGETTPDGRITLHDEEECLAACTGAPMMWVNGHYYENVTLEKADEILDGLE